MTERDFGQDAEGRPIFKAYASVVEPTRSGTAIIDFIRLAEGPTAILEWTHDWRPVVQVPLDPTRLTAIADAKATHIYQDLPVVHPSLRA